MKYVDLTQLSETMAAMERRVAALEKEMADLKSQVEIQPERLAGKIADTIYSSLQKSF